MNVKGTAHTPSVVLDNHLPVSTNPDGENSRQWSGNKRLGGEFLKNIVDNYIRYYASGDGHTARAKRYDLQYFLDFIAKDTRSINDVLVSEWTLQITKDFVDNRLSRGESPATVSRRLATIKHFGRTLAERVPGYINPAREARGPSLQQTKPHGLTADEIRLLKQAALEDRKTERNSFRSVRNQFLLELLLATGLRADEVRLLTMNQLSEDRCWLRNVKTKGRKFRNVYLDTKIRKLFSAYLEARNAHIQSQLPLILSLPISEQKKYPVIISTHFADSAKPNSLGLAPKTIWRIIAAFATKARALATSPISNLHPHKLRHTFAHGLLDSTKDVRLVAQALGHSDVRTTMRYTERTEEEIAKAIEKKVLNTK